MLAEPITWELLGSSSSRPLQVGVVIAHLLFPIAIVPLALSACLVQI
jgi:hypothetical protein